MGLSALSDDTLNIILSYVAFDGTIYNGAPSTPPSTPRTRLLLARTGAEPAPPLTASLSESNDRSDHDAAPFTLTSVATNLSRRPTRGRRSKAATPPSPCTDTCSGLAAFRSIDTRCLEVADALRWLGMPGAAHMRSAHPPVPVALRRMRLSLQATLHSHVAAAAEARAARAAHSDSEQNRTGATPSAAGKALIARRQTTVTSGAGTGTRGGQFGRRLTGSARATSTVGVPGPVSGAKPPRNGREARMMAKARAMTRVTLAKHRLDDHIKSSSAGQRASDSDDHTVASLVAEATSVAMAHTRLAAEGSAAPPATIAPAASVDGPLAMPTVLHLTTASCDDGALEASAADLNQSAAHAATAAAAFTCFREEWDVVRRIEANPDHAPPPYVLARRKARTARSQTLGGAAAVASESPAAAPVEVPTASALLDAAWAHRCEHADTGEPLGVAPWAAADSRRHGASVSSSTVTRAAPGTHRGSSGPVRVTSVLSPTISSAALERVLTVHLHACGACSLTDKEAGFAAAVVSDIWRGAITAVDLGNCNGLRSPCVAMRAVTHLKVPDTECRSLQAPKFTLPNLRSLTVTQGRRLTASAFNALALNTRRLLSVDIGFAPMLHDSALESLLLFNASLRELRLSLCAGLSRPRIVHSALEVLCIEGMPGSYEPDAMLDMPSFDVPALAVMRFAWLPHLKPGAVVQAMRSAAASLVAVSLHACDALSEPTCLVANALANDGDGSGARGHVGTSTGPGVGGAAPYERLQHLELSGMDFFDATLTRIAQSCAALQSLIVEGNSALRSPRIVSRSLQALEISGVLDRAMAVALWHDPPPCTITSVELSCPDLRHLAIHGCTEVTSATLPLEHLPDSCPRLQTLYIATPRLRVPVVVVPETLLRVEFDIRRGDVNTTATGISTTGGATRGPPGTTVLAGGRSADLEATFALLHGRVVRGSGDGSFKLPRVVIANDTGSSTTVPFCAGAQGPRALARCRARSDSASRPRSAAGHVERATHANVNDLCASGTAAQRSDTPRRSRSHSPRPPPSSATHRERHVGGRKRALTIGAVLVGATNGSGRGDGMQTASDGHWQAARVSHVEVAVSCDAATVSVQKVTRAIARHPEMVLHVPPSRGNDGSRNAAGGEHQRRPWAARAGAGVATGGTRSTRATPATTQGGWGGMPKGVEYRASATGSARAVRVCARVYRL